MLCWAQLWDVEAGVERVSLVGHRAEIVSLNFNTAGVAWSGAPSRAWQNEVLVQQAESAPVESVESGRGTRVDARRGLDHHGLIRP